MPRGCGDWEGAAGLGASTPTADDATSCVATSCAPSLSLQVTKMAGTLHRAMERALDRGSRVPRASSHTGGARRCDSDKPLLGPWFVWSVKASGWGSSQQGPSFRSVLDPRSLPTDEGARLASSHTAFCRCGGFGTVPRLSSAVEPEASAVPVCPGLRGFPGVREPGWSVHGGSRQSDRRCRIQGASDSPSCRGRPRRPLSSPSHRQSRVQLAPELPGIFRDDFRV